MRFVCGVILLAGALPMFRLCSANRKTTLIHAAAWATVAWTAWLLVLFVPNESAVTMLRYVALSLTACAGIAVFGARRPGAGPWNFVVLALLVLNLSPLAEGALTGRDIFPGELRAICLAGTLFVGTVNYVPTSFGVAALTAMAGSTCTLLSFFYPNSELAVNSGMSLVGNACIAVTPWLAYLATFKRRDPSQCMPDKLWLEFRDRFGFVWAERLREQFNRASVHSGLAVRLGWRGLELLNAEKSTNAAVEVEAAGILRSLMRRFEFV
jgi:hypothetical protein